MNTARTIRITAFFSALVMSIAINGTTLMAFDHVTQTAQASNATVGTVALHTVTITAKRA